ncbi:MAG: hypothetical protein RLZZ339_2039 [Cyanobacteriota bacterium]|jgi:hypothetical protein
MNQPTAIKGSKKKELDSKNESALPKPWSALAFRWDAYSQLLIYL